MNLPRAPLSHVSSPKTLPYIENRYSAQVLRLILSSKKYWGFTESCALKGINYSRV